MQHKKRNLEKRNFLPWTAAALLGVSDHGFMWGRSCSSPFHLAQANRNMHVALLSLFFLSWFLETSKQTPRNVIIDFRKEKCAVTNYYWEQSYNYSHIKSSLFANNRPVRWLISGLISLADAGLLWEKSTVGWLISPDWNQQANWLNIRTELVGAHCTATFSMSCSANRHHHLAKPT